MHWVLRTAPHPVPWACPLEQLACRLTPSHATLAPDIPGHLPRVCDTRGSGGPQLCLVEQAGARALTETDSSMSFLLRRAWLIRSTIQSNRALYRDLAMESRAVIACGHTAGSVTLRRGPCAAPPRGLHSWGDRGCDSEERPTPWPRPLSLCTLPLHSGAPTTKLGPGSLTFSEGSLVSQPTTPSKLGNC